MHKIREKYEFIEYEVRDGRVCDVVGNGTAPGARRVVRRYSDLVAGPALRTPPPRTRRPATQYKASITVPDCPGPER